MLFKTIFVTLLVICSSFPEEENYDSRLFDSDIMLTEEQRKIVASGGDIAHATMSHSYTAMQNVSILWLPNNKVVPYDIAPDLENIAEATFTIMQALREWEERSCLTFRRRTTQIDYIRFFQESGCWSYVGRQGGAQNISLGQGCWNIGTVVHEIGHAMGFGHEQSRPDRDQYIKIRWENIEPDDKYNFQKYSNSEVDSFNSPYDYKSFMQYSKTAFGINDSVTLDPINPDIFQLGQRLGFTKEDQYQTMQLYRCQGKTTRKAKRMKTYRLNGEETCDFENGMCIFTQDKNDDFDWMRRYGGTPSGGTGPESDHTTGRMGTYLYIEASFPRKKNDKARLLTKEFQPNQHPKCLTFFYHMFSLNKSMMGDFNVYLNDDLRSQKVLFHKNGSQLVNDWIKINVKFIPIGKYQLTFEGVRGADYRGDIALDDITFSSGVCHTHPVHKKKKETHCNKKDKKDKHSHKKGKKGKHVHKKEKKDCKCKDTKDREGKYCTQWKKEGYCDTRRKVMMKFCKQTCKFC